MTNITNNHVSSNIHDDYLNNLRVNNINISIYLMNGIKLSGYIAQFDMQVIILKDNKNTVEQLIYRHAISTIVPKTINS